MLKSVARCCRERYSPTQQTDANNFVPGMSQSHQRMGGTVGFAMVRDKGRVGWRLRVEKSIPLWKTNLASWSCIVNLYKGITCMIAPSHRGFSGICPLGWLNACHKDLWNERTQQRAALQNPRSIFRFGWVRESQGISNETTVNQHASESWYIYIIC